MAGADPAPPLTAFTVGIICALPVEHEAVSLSLDPVYGAPRKVPPNDSNSYTLGKIGDHNVVLAVLPKGEYGVTSASGVAECLIHAFPNIRLGLMVGIGGGCPSSDNDIRLGDIVVSIPGDGASGVMQYDFGRVEQGKDFRRTSHLNQPPAVLRSAVSSLQSKYSMEGHTIQADIESRMDRRKLRPKFKATHRKPDVQTDRLFRSELLHEEGTDGVCRACAGLDHSALIGRRPRSVEDDDDDPAIFYGLIASGNSLIKDATLRDRMAQDDHVLCFEMEAAGLMNRFPCLVIRGICDYCDSHKNKAWQPYAAMTAAAYATDLLELIPPTQVEDVSPISETLVAEAVKEIAADTKATNVTVNSIARSKRQHAMETWLAPPDPSVNQALADDVRHPGTCEWVLSSDEFATWLRQPRNVLWLTGISGSGKTVIASSIVRHLQQRLPRSVVLFFYFSKTDATGRKTTLSGMLRSLAMQLFSQCEDACQALNSLFKAANGGTVQASSHELSAALRDMLGQVRDQEVHLVVDAMDECDEWERVIDCLAELVRLGLKIVFTSQPRTGIDNVFDSMGWTYDFLFVDHRSIGSDIRDYVHYTVRFGSALSRFRDRSDLQDLIEETLVSRADGMFRWVACQFDTIRRCISQGELEEALKKLPRTLGDTYFGILDRMERDYRQQVLTLLQCIVFQTVTLDVDETFDAIAVDSGSGKFRKQLRPLSAEVVMSMCPSLVVIVYSHEPEGIIPYAMQLAHASVGDYLNTGPFPSWVEGAFEPGAGNGKLAAICVNYLRSITALEPIERHDKIYRLGYFLRQHAGLHWSDYVAGATMTEELFQKLWGLCAEDEAARKVAINCRGTGFRSTRSLSFCCNGGLLSHAEALIKAGFDVNDCEPGKYNPLQSAAEGGHVAIVELLLNSGASPDDATNQLESALHIASGEGFEEIANVLIRRGADVNQRHSIWGTPLEMLLSYGSTYDQQFKRDPTIHTATKWQGSSRERILHTLMQSGVDVNANLSQYGPPLILASAMDDENVIRLLLQRGADPNSRTRNQKKTALTEALEAGHERIVDILVAHGAQLDGKGCLKAAVHSGKRQLVEMVLSPLRTSGNLDAELNAALLEAAREQDRSSIVMLLDAGADVNGSSSQEPAALQNVVEKGNLELTDLLIQSGANVNVAAGYTWMDIWGTPLQIAASKGRLDLAKLLVEHGADLDAGWVIERGRRSRHGCALQMAIYGKHDDMVDYLLDAGADPNFRGGLWLTPLQAAVESGRTQVICKLLAAGAKINAEGTDLFKAAVDHGLDVMQLLIDNGAKVDVNGGAIHEAAAKGDIPMVEKLLELGADVNADAGYWKSPLYAAVCKGQADVVGFLLARGANIIVERGGWGAPLTVAAERGFKAVVEVLLANDAQWVTTEQGGPIEAAKSRDEDDSEAIVAILEAFRLSHGL